MIGKRILQDLDATARPCVEAVILVDHVWIAPHRTVFCQEQDAFEIEERVAECDRAAEPARLLVKGVALVIQLDVHHGGFLGEGSELVPLGGEIRGSGLSCEMGQQRLAPAQDDIERIPVAGSQEGGRVLGLTGHAIAPSAVLHFLLQAGELGAPFTWQIRRGP